MISLGTNVVIRFLLDDMPEQTVICDNLINGSQTYITDAVILESVYVLEKTIKLPRTDIADLLLGLLGFANVQHNKIFLTETIRFWTNHPALSIVDCYVAFESKLYNNTLSTFDKKLAGQGGSHINLLLTTK